MMPNGGEPVDVTETRAVPEAASVQYFTGFGLADVHGVTDPRPTPTARPTRTPTETPTATPRPRRLNVAPSVETVAAPF